jgi:nucleotide-binding universal stress UspA family protein
VSRQLLLQGDPRDAIINFVREEGLDLLLVGRSLGGRFKKVLR